MTGVFCFAVMPILAGIAGGEDIFEKASKKYDEVMNKYEKIKGKDEKADQSKKINAEDYAELKKMIDEAIDLFDQYVRVGTSEDSKKAARHYILVLNYYDFTFKNDLGKFSENYRNIKKLDEDLGILKGYYYPIRYSTGGRNYIIEAEKRANIERNLLVEFVEASTNSSKSADVVAYAKRAYSLYTLGDYNLWWTAHLWYYHANKLYYSGFDMADPAEKVIYSMSGLKKSDIKKIRDSNWVNYTHAYEKLNYLLSSKPELSRNGEVWAKAAESFEKLDEDAKALEYYNKALKDGYGDKTYLLKMMDYGKRKKNTELVGTAATAFDSKNLYYTYYCDEYNTLADYFEYAGNTAKSTELKDKHAECVKTQDKKKRREERGGRLLVSFAPLPLLSGNLQGSIQVGGNKRMHEFGIRLVDQQKDLGYDSKVLKAEEDNPKNMIWSGQAFYYTYKRFLGRDGGMYPYFGFQLRYTDKKYEPQTAAARDGSVYRNTVFNPVEKRYDFVMQGGYMVIGRFFHLDIYYGMGVGYSQFDKGGPPGLDYEVRNHRFLTNRPDTRLGTSWRLGLKLGINLVNLSKRY